jgi:hypothetical protein
MISDFTSSGKAYRDRMLEDAIQVERDLRTRAEGIIGQYREAMKKVAFVLAGVDLENARLHNPDQVNTWDPETWAAFLIEKVNAGNNTAVSSAWNATTTAEKQAGKNGTSLAELDKARCDIKELRLLLTQKEQIIKELEGNIRTITSEYSSLRKKTKGVQDKSRSLERKQGLSSQVREVCGYLETIVGSLNSLRISNPPAAFEGRVALKDSPQRYQRQVRTLYILSQYGLCNRVEIDRILSEVESVSPRSYAIRRPIDELAAADLVKSDVLEMTDPFKTSLKVLQLTEDGKKLCQAYGWDIVPGEWERLIKAYKGESKKVHVFGILAFTLHARLRGWDVEILPTNEGLYKPDLAVKNSHERYLVEVEGSDSPKDKKWKNLAPASPEGKAAICAFDPQDRKKLVSDCKLAGIGGVATDLRTLIFGEKGSSAISILAINEEMKLWYETF